MRVAIDSNALTYLLEAMEPGYDPVADDSALARERLAMIRSYLYAEQYFYVLPEVETEYRKIRHEDWRKAHESLVGTLLMEVFWVLDFSAVAHRKELFLKYHSKISDCQLIAEAEVARMDVFLTKDDDLTRRLSTLTKVHIVTPSLFWDEFKVAPGSTPKILPHPTNPLCCHVWWRV
jgi:predicted nucleic acid-binding protein